MRKRLALALVLAAAVAAGCAGSEGGEQPETAPATGRETPSPGPTTETQAPTPTQAEPEPVRLALERVGEPFDEPLHVTFAPGEPARLYVVERGGAIWIVRRDDGRRLRRLLSVADRITAGGEQGLLSLAFHPDYERNRRFYLNFTDRAGDTRVVEYVARGGGGPVERRELLGVDQPYANHNGGQLVFGPDGLLYVGMGDGGSAGDPENRAQDLSSPLGKLLRIDVDAPGARWETVAYGLRNPWRFSFDRETGDLYIGDVGQGAREEIDYLPAGTTGLVNFGWDVFEGSQRFEDKEPNPRGRLVGPIAEYPHPLGCSVTGGFVYRGAAVPPAQGRYFYGDYCSGLVWSLAVRDGEPSRPRRERFRVAGLSSFGEDADGELYLVSLRGALFRLAAR